MKNFVSRFANNESGATAIEYGLIAGIVGVGIITALGLLQTELDAIFTRIANALKTKGV